MTLDIPALLGQLKREEGFRAKPYTDSVGKLTIGYGRNLTDVGIYEPEAETLLLNDIGRACNALDIHLPWWRKLDPIRQRVLADLAFNLGIMGLMGFKHALEAAERGDWPAMAAALKNSRWFSQVGRRGVRLVDMALTGHESQW